jgi:hypothetical protein
MRSLSARAFVVFCWYLADPENALKVASACGEISDEEYRRRLAVLREK